MFIIISYTVLVVKGKAPVEFIPLAFLMGFAELMLEGMFAMRVAGLS